jgi:hypothetical protein
MEESIRTELGFAQFSFDKKNRENQEDGEILKNVQCSGTRERITKAPAGHMRALNECNYLCKGSRRSPRTEEWKRNVGFHMLRTVMRRARNMVVCAPSRTSPAKRLANDWRKKGKMRRGPDVRYKSEEIWCMRLRYFRAVEGVSTRTRRPG